MKFYNTLNNLTNFLDIKNLHRKTRTYTLNQLKTELTKQSTINKINNIKQFKDFKYLSSTPVDLESILSVEFVLTPLFNFNNINVTFDIPVENLITIRNNEFIVIKKLEDLIENNIITIEFTG